MGNQASYHLAEWERTADESVSGGHISTGVAVDTAFAAVEADAKFFGLVALRFDETNFQLDLNRRLNLHGVYGIFVETFCYFACFFSGQW